MKLYTAPTYTVHSTAGEYATAEELNEGAAQMRQATADTYSPHVMTQVDRLRNKGFVGKGIKVAVVDTGVSEPSPGL